MSGSSLAVALAKWLAICFFVFGRHLEMGFVVACSSISKCSPTSIPVTEISKVSDKMKAVGFAYFP
jgi:hypothetical protein